MDEKALKVLLAKKGTTIKDVCVAIKMDPSTFYRKIGKSGKSFTVGEVQEISYFLKMSDKEFMSIFFDNSIASMQHVK